MEIADGFFIFPEQNDQSTGGIDKHEDNRQPSGDAVQAQVLTLLRHPTLNRSPGIED